MKERKKPTQSWLEKSKNDIENEEELLAKRLESLNDIRIKKLLYEDSEAFKIGYEAGKQEMIEKACEWIETHLFDIGFPDDWCRDLATMKSGKQRFIEAMEV